MPGSPFELIWSIGQDAVALVGWVAHIFSAYAGGAPDGIGPEALAAGGAAGAAAAAAASAGEEGSSSTEPEPFDPPWWWPVYQLLSGLAPDPSPPGFDPLDPTLGPPAVEGGMDMVQELKAKQALKRGDTDEYYRIRNLSREQYMKEFGK